MTPHRRGRPDRVFAVPTVGLYRRAGPAGAATHGWGSARTLVHLAASVGLLAAFAAVERRASQPLAPTTTWRIRSLVSSATVMLGATGLLVGSFFLNSLFMQNVLGASALGTGAAFLPLVVVIGVAAHVGPHLLARVGARTVVAAALVVVATGYALLTGASPGSSYAPDLFPGFTAMSEIDDERAGLASGLMTTAHELGGAFGVSIFSAFALGTGGAGGTALQSGYGDGAAAGALIAGLLALVAVSVVPSFRPAPAHGVSMH